MKTITEQILAKSTAPAQQSLVVFMWGFISGDKVSQSDSIEVLNNSKPKTIAIQRMKIPIQINGG